MATARAALAAILCLPACATVGTSGATLAVSATTPAGAVDAPSAAPAPSVARPAPAESTAVREAGPRRLTARRVGLILLVIVGLTGLSLLVGG